MGDEVPEKDYDLSNLPPEAFADPNGGVQVEEEEIVPMILSLTLNKRKYVKDNEPDNCGEISISKDAATKQLSLLIGNDFNLLKARAFKNKIKGLNALQTILNKEYDLDSNADAVYKGLESLIGWKERISGVNSMLIDIFRTTLVKSNNIKKSTIAIIIPFLVEKLNDSALKKPSSELLEIIAEAICPSFVLLHACTAISTMKNAKAQNSALEVILNIVEVFGLGNISIENFLPVLIKLLENTNKDVKAKAIKISSYIYKELGETFQKQLETLPNSVQNMLNEEFKESKNLPNPSKKFYRTSNVNALEELAKLNEQLNKEKAAEDAQKAKISNVITPDVLAAAASAQKFKDFDEFFKTIDGAIAEMPYIMTSDLGPVMSLFKDYMTKSDRIILNTFATLAKIAQKADGDFGKYARTFAPYIVQRWTDFSEHNRDIVTATINAFLPKSGPTPFIDALTKVSTDAKFVMGSRLSSLAWMESNFSTFTPPDIEKLKTIVQPFMNDKVANVRKEAQKILDLCGVPPKPKEENLAKTTKEIPSSPITRQVRKKTKSTEKNQNESSMIVQKEKEKEKEEKPVVETPRFTQATASKKQKRLALLVKIGQALISNKQNIVPFGDKCKLDASNHLPPSYTSKLFSNQMNEQLKVLEDMTQFFEGNETNFYNCSDIFLRWFILKLFDKNIKVVLDGIQFISKLYTENNLMTSQELDMIVPVIIWCIDNKSQQIVDSVLDLLVTIRLHTDVNEYSLSLRACIPGASTQALLHIFSELQLCVGENSSNKEVFFELMGFANSNEVGVSAACGGVLALIAKNMTQEQKTNLFNSFTQEQIEFLMPFIPINTSSDVTFEDFSESSQADKAHILRTLVQQLSTNPDAVEFQAQTIVEQLSKELMQTEANYGILKHTLFVLHEATSRFDVTNEALQEELGSICFVATYFNRSLKAIDGVAQMINSLIYKLFEKLPAALSFISLLRSMETVESVTATSFFAKAFVVLVSSVIDREEAELEEAKKYLQSQLPSIQASVSKQKKDDVRVQLVETAIQAITQKFAPPVTTVAKKSVIAKNDEVVSKRPSIKSQFVKEETPKKQQKKNSIFDDSSSILQNSPQSKSNLTEVSDILSPQKEKRSSFINEEPKPAPKQNILRSSKKSAKNEEEKVTINAKPVRSARKSVNNNNNNNDLVISALPKEEQSPVKIVKSPIKMMSPVVKSPRESAVTPTKRSMNENLLNTPSPMNKASEMPTSPKISPMKMLYNRDGKDEPVKTTMLTPTKDGKASPTRLEIITQSRGSPVAKALSTAINNPPAKVEEKKDVKNDKPRMSTGSKSSKHATKKDDQKATQMKARIEALRKRWGK